MFGAGSKLAEFPPGTFSTRRWLRSVRVAASAERLLACPGARWTIPQFAVLSKSSGCHPHLRNGFAVSGDSGVGVIGGVIFPMPLPDFMVDAADSEDLIAVCEWSFHSAQFSNQSVRNYGSVDVDCAESNSTNLDSEPGIGKNSSRERLNAVYLNKIEEASLFLPDFS
jgi:hypothetical protein